MDIKTMSVDELEQRKAAIGVECDNEDADIDALTEELRSIKEEIENRKAIEAKKVELRKAAAESGVTVETIEKEERKTMTNMEVRNTKEYIEAYARYFLTENDAECRALLTETVSGSVPVPAFVDEGIKAAWENDGILSRVRRVEIRGNLKVPFELSAGAAVAHTEGTTAVTEESLSFGIVTMIPKNIKKLVRISDEALAMGGEALLRYVYDEATYQIIKLLASLVIADITGSPTSADADEVGVPQISSEPGTTTVSKAAANLSDAAVNPVVIMNRLTEGNFADAFAAGNFAVDPFQGLTRVYTSALPAYDTATAGSGIYAIVGDLRGATVNFPEGDDVIIKLDDTSEAEADLVKVVGRIYAAHDVTGPGMFCNIVKPAAVTT